MVESKEPEVEYLNFASESVGEGHPDKLCDQISDGILDACLKVDPDAKVAMETATKTGLVSAFPHPIDGPKIINSWIRHLKLELLTSVF